MVLTKVWVAFAVMLALATAGCGGSDEDEQEASASRSQGETVRQFSASWENYKAAILRGDLQGHRDVTSDPDRTISAAYWFDYCPHAGCPQPGDAPDTPMIEVMGASADGTAAVFSIRDNWGFAGETPPVLVHAREARGGRWRIALLVYLRGGDLPDAVAGAELRALNDVDLRWIDKAPDVRDAILQTGRVPTESGFGENAYSQQLIAASRTWKPAEPNEVDEERRAVDATTSDAGFSLPTRHGRLSCAVYRAHVTIRDRTGAPIDPSWLGDYSFKVPPGDYGSFIEERLGPVCVLRPPDGPAQVLAVAVDRISARGTPPPA